MAGKHRRPGQRPGLPTLAVAVFVASALLSAFGTPAGAAQASTSDRASVATSAFATSLSANQQWGRFQHRNWR